MSGASAVPVCRLRILCFRNTDDISSTRHRKLEADALSSLAAIKVIHGTHNLFDTLQ